MSEAIPITLKAKDKRELVQKLRFGASLNCDIRYALDPTHARLMADCIEMALDLENVHNQRLAVLEKIKADIAPQLQRQAVMTAVQFLLVLVLWASLIWGAS
jgi:hypothetical protein